MGRRGRLHSLEFGLFCLCLEDPSFSCSSLVLERLPFDLIFQPSSVAGGLADGPPGVRRQLSDGPRCLHGWSVIVGAVLEVCESFSDSPPLPRGRSTVGSQTIRQEHAESPLGTAQGC
jgi:hypothetical protein